MVIHAFAAKLETILKPESTNPDFHYKKCRTCGSSALSVYRISTYVHWLLNFPHRTVTSQYALNCGMCFGV